MKKQVIGILVCFLMIGSTFVCVSGMSTATDTSQYQFNQIAKVINIARSQLDSARTKEEALTAVKDIIYELHSQGLLPGGMSAESAQRLISQTFLRSQLLTPYQGSQGNTTGNSNCLIIGIANRTSFFPFPSIVDFPLIIEFINTFYTNHHLASRLLILPFLIRSFQPFKCGAKAIIGKGLWETKNGNITIDSNLPAKGWVWTFGMGGAQNWNGSFYGNLYTISGNGSFDNTSWGNWACVGIQGFVGINFLNLISAIGDNKIVSIYIGFARKVNMTYNAPWWV